jgi:hypothetical protein
MLQDKLPNGSTGVSTRRLEPLAKGHEALRLIDDNTNRNTQRPPQNVNPHNGDIVDDGEAFSEYIDEDA